MGGAGAQDVALSGAGLAVLAFLGGSGAGIPSKEAETPEAQKIRNAPGPTRGGPYRMTRRHSENQSRTSTRRWQQLRRLVFRRDHYRCRACGKAGALECDHLVPIWKGGAPWALGNLQALCRGCHIEKSRKEYTGRKRRPRTDAERRWTSLVAEMVAGR